MNGEEATFREPRQFLDGLDADFAIWDPTRDVKERLTVRSLDDCRRWMWTRGEGGSL